MYNGLFSNGLFPNGPSVFPNGAAGSKDFTITSTVKEDEKHVVDLTEDDTPPLKVVRTNSHSTSADFECPINCSFMKDPVVDILGHTYDRSALERWLKRKLVSPLTGENYVDVLRRRKMSNSRDTQSMIREKIIVATNYSMIQNSTWKLFKENA